MHFRLLLVLVALCLFCGMQQVADRIIAIVNGEPVLLSELYRFSLVNGQQLDEEDDLLQNRLDGLINRTLMLQEIRVLRIFDVTTSEVEQMRERMAESFSVSAESQLLQVASMDAADLDSLIRESILIIKFIDYKFRRGAAISLDDQRQYYQQELLPQLRENGVASSEIPVFNQVQDDIENILIERIVTRRLEQWITVRRAESRIEIRY